jgi:ABC-type hemin transport system ATPase subunit
LKSVIIEEIIKKVDQTYHSYYRLVLLVGPVCSGKTTVLKKLQQELDVPIINVNLELSRRMLELTEQQRVIQLPRLMEDLIKKIKGDKVVLDNTELLFEPSLKQDSLRLLQKLSRNQTIIASWNGTIEDGYLVHAEPGHPEYRRYSTQEILYVSLSQKNQ